MTAATRKTATELAIAHFRASCRPSRLRAIPQWAEEEIVPPTGPRQSLKYRLDYLPWSGLLLRELGKWRVHIITGPVQSGKSLHAFVMPILYYLFEVGEDVIVGLPDIEMAKKKWESDIKPAILASSYADLIPDRGAGSKGGKPVQIRFNNGRTLTFMGGGGGDEQRASATSRVLCITETDKIDEVSGTSKEGQNKIDQLFGRTEAFDDNACIFCECTTSTDDAYTWREYQESSTASRIVCRCVHCGEWVTPERDDFVGWQDASDIVAAGEGAAFSCPECGVLYDESERREMNVGAKLLHRGQEITPEGEVVGDPFPTDRLGFRWNGFNNLLVSQKILGQKEWEVAHRSEENREAAEAAVKQQSHCLPVKNENIEKIDISIGVVRGSATNYAGRCTGIPVGEIPGSPDIITAMIDVSRRYLQWSVEAKVDKHIHVAEYQFHETTDPDVVGDEQAIREALHEVRNDIESRYNVNVGLVDCGNWRELILGVLSEWNSPVWKPSHGLPNYKHPRSQDGQVLVPEDGSRHWHLKRDESIWVVNFNPDTCKHRVHSGFLIRPMRDGSLVPGCVTLPGADPGLHTKFAEQVTAEIWTSEFVKGRGIKKVWKKIRKHNHMLDCCVGHVVGRSVGAFIDARSRGIAKVEDSREPKEERFVRKMKSLLGGR